MIVVDQSKFDFSYMAWDVAMTLEECKCENIPCEYLGLGRTDSDNAKSVTQSDAIQETTRSGSFTQKAKAVLST